MFCTINISYHMVCVMQILHILLLSSRLISSLILVFKCNFHSITVVLMLKFSQSTYSGTESSGVVPVTLMLEGGSSPFVITVTVIPSDQSAGGKR